MRILLFILTMLLATKGWTNWVQDVPHSDTNVLVHVGLWQAGGAQCLSDSTITTNAGLSIKLSSNAGGVIDTYTEAAGELQTIAAIGTHVDPTAGSIRIQRLGTDSCIYELQLPDSVYATAGATVLNFEFTGDPTMMPGIYKVNLVP